MGAVEHHVEQPNEERARALQETHDHRVQAVARLSRAVAHEVNGPLQQAESNLRFLECALEGTTDEVRAALQQTLEGLHRVAAGVHALQRFARNDDSDRGRCDVNAALRLALTLATAEIRLGGDLEAELGDLAPVHCDPVDLHEVFLCLLLNAARSVSRAFGEQRRRGLVRVESRCEDGYAIVAITDTGVGIPRELQPRLFDPSATSEARRRSGEGLPLAHALVTEKHGGQLSFATEPGVGTTFTVRLPLAR